MFCSFRFDLIFLMLDPQDELFDRRLAKHLVSLYYQGADDLEQENIVSHRISNEQTIPNALYYMYVYVEIDDNDSTHSQTV